MKVSKKLKVSNLQKEYQTKEKPKRPNDPPGAKRGLFLGFSTSSLSPSIKKLKEVPFEKNSFERKSHNAKKVKGGAFSIARYCMLRGKTGKTFLVQFARQNGSV